MGKITWNDRTNSGADSKISASIFNDTKTSVNRVYDVLLAKFGSTSSIATDSLSISGTILISGSIIPNVSSGEITSSFDLGSENAAWKDIYVSDGSIKFVKSGETTDTFTKEDVSKLKKGEPIATDLDKALVSQRDTSSFIRTSTRGRMTHYVGNNVAIDLVGTEATQKITLGGLNGASTGLPVSVPGPLTLSGGISGSLDVTGSGNFFGMTVQEVLDVLAGANIGGDTSISGSTNVTGSLIITGSSTLSGSIDLEGVTTTYDLLNAIAGFEATGSVNVSGSTFQTGSINHQGSTNTLPPPLVVSSPPTNDTLFYGYQFTGGAAPSAIEVQANSTYDPNALNYFRFSTASQAAYGDPTPTSRYSFFEGLEASASNDNPIHITFTPVVNYPNDSYKFAITGIVDSSSAALPYYQANITFIESSSLGGGTAPIYINFSGGGANGRWKFTVLPPEEDEPTGGWAAGDLLNLLSAFGDTNVPIGSIGDFNFDGSVNMSDLLLVLGGFGNSNVMCNDVLIPQGSNHQFVGPVISICEGNVYIIAEGSFSGITP